MFHDRGITVLHGPCHHNAPEFLSSQCSMTVSSKCFMALVSTMLQNSSHHNFPWPCHHNARWPLSSDSSRRQESQRLSPPGWRNPGSEKGVITTQGQRAKPQPQICVTLSHAVSITYSWLVGWPTKLVCLEVWGFLGCRNLNFSFKLRISWENQDKLIIQLLRERQKWRLGEVTLKTEQKKDPVLILGR